MNPLYNALTNAQNGLSQPVQPQMNISSPAPQNGIQGVVDRARQLMQSMRDPRQFVRQYIPGVPDEIAGDPNQILNWMQQTGKINPQLMQTAQQLRQMMTGQ